LIALDQSDAFVHSTKGGIKMIKFEKRIIINRHVEDVWIFLNKERIA